MTVLRSVIINMSSLVACVTLAAMSSAASPSESVPAPTSSLSSSGGSAPLGAPGCCPGPNVGELEIDVLDDPNLNVGVLVGNHFQFTHGVVFAPATVNPAPDFPDVRVWIDQARPEECDLTLARQWAFSGEPHFPPSGDGDEVFQFWNDEPMVVDRVRVSVGFANGIGTVVVRAYDCQGELLEEHPNAVEGFQDFDIDRRFTDPDIHYVTVEAPGDDQGVGINCIRFPPPVPCGGTVSVDPVTWGRVKAKYGR